MTVNDNRSESMDTVQTEMVKNENAPKWWVSDDTGDDPQPFSAGDTAEDVARLAAEEWWHWTPEEERRTRRVDVEVVPGDAWSPAESSGMTADMAAIYAASDLWDEIQETITVTLEAEEPDCDEADGHDWEDGQARGHGGGVIYADTCRHCGLERETDTWAPDGSGGHDTVVTFRLPEPEYDYDFAEEGAWI